MIEKNIRLQPHHSRDLLVGRRSDGRRPGYQPPGGGDPDMSYSAPSDNGGNDDGGWSPSVSYSPPAYTTPSPHRDTAADLMAEATRMEAERKAIESIITGDTDDTDGRSAAKIQQFVNPRRKEIITHTAHSDIPVKTIVPDKKLTTTYGTSVTDPYGVPKESFWDSGIGKALKVGATIVAPPLAGAVLPKNLMTALTWGKRAHDFSKGKGTAAWLAKKAGIDPTKLTSNLKSKMLADKPKVAEKVWGPQKYLQPKKKTVHTDDNGGANVTQIIPETLQSTVSEGTKMFVTDEQREQYRLAQNKMKAALAEGFYIDKDGKHVDLSEEQVSALTQWITKINDMLIDPMPVGAAEGGRIDRPLTGRSRDIG